MSCGSAPTPPPTRRRWPRGWIGLGCPQGARASPVRDGERYLAEAIESVLAQTHRCRQVIVVDNGSSDGSAEVARRYEPDVEVHSEPRPGIGPARNAALATAEGDFLAFLDADDL